MSERLHGLLRGVHLLALAVWLGGAVLLFAGVAPIAFEVIPRALHPGRLVGAVINRLDLIAMISVPVLLVTAYVDEARRGTQTARWVRMSVLACLGVCAAISRLVITPRLVALRSADLPGAAGEFRMLHGISMALMLLGVVCALLGLYFASRKRPLADALASEAGS